MKSQLILILLFGIFFSSCDPTTNNSCAPDFDQEALLVHYADNIIVPAYTDFNISCDSLYAKTVKFTNTPNADHLYQLRSALQTAWESYQLASIFEFGPAFDMSLRINLNRYPVFAQRLEQTLDTAQYEPLAKS